MKYILDYDKYNDDLIYVIDEDGKDHKVKDLFSYSSWIENYDCHNVKVEGIDTNIDFPHPIKNIHLFYSGVGGVSFKEHCDDVNVFLYVTKGEKKVHMNGKISLLKKNQGVIIPKGVYHKVDSEPGTIAYSIGY